MAIKDTKGRFVKGNIPWCKGLTKKDDKRIMNIALSKTGCKSYNWISGRYFDGKTVYINENGKRYIESHKVWCIKNQIGCVPINYEIHHIDLNPENNNKDNLVLLDKKTHRSLHYNIQLNQDPNRIYFGKNQKLRGEL